jgi:hypothetical protein
MRGLRGWDITIWYEGVGTIIMRLRSWLQSEGTLRIQITGRATMEVIGIRPDWMFWGMVGVDRGSSDGPSVGESTTSSDSVAFELELEVDPTDRGL